MPELKTPPTYDSRSPRDWLEMADRGEVVLPTFQRSRVWKRPQTAEYLRALLEGRPTGAFLILGAAEQLQFRCRLLHGVGGKNDLAQETGDSGLIPGSASKVKELVLDGQQRLTSLWRALVGMGARYFVGVEDLKAGDLRVKEVVWRSQRWSNPAKMHRDNWVPVDILWYDRPSLVGSNATTQGSNVMKEWAEAAVGKERWGALFPILMKIRERLLDRPKLHFCRLSKDTDRDTAVDIFINVNRSAIKLRQIDIIVAIAEADHEEDLRARAARYLARSTEAKHYFNRTAQTEIPEIAAWMLKVGCLQVRNKQHRHGLAPKESHYPSALEQLFGLRDGEEDRAKDTRLRQFEDDLDLALRFAAHRGGATKRTLPAWPPVHVIAALQNDVRAAVAVCPDCRDEVDGLLSAYMWRSFVTSRYNAQANDRLLEDYRALRQYIGRLVAWRKSGGSRPKLEVPAFDEKAHRLPERGDVQSAGWIGGASRLGRAVAAVVMAESPLDWVTGEKLDLERVRELEAEGKLVRHQVFSKASFGEALGRQIPIGLNGVLLARGDVSLKNCDPDSILKRIQEHDPGVDDLKFAKRLHSHLIQRQYLKKERPPWHWYMENFIGPRSDLVALKMREVARWEGPRG